MNSLLTEYPIVAVLGEMDRLLHLQDDDDESLHKENPEKISSFLHKIEALFIQLGEILNENLSFLTPASVKGFLNDLQQFKDILTLYESKSRLYKLVHCRGLNDILTTMVHKLAHSLATVALGLPEYSELCNGFNDLSSEMKSTQLKVSDIEDLICSAIDEELNNGTNDSANDTLMINLARELRMTNCHDASQFSSEIEMYKKDIEDSISPRDLQIAEVLEKLFRNQSSEPHETIVSPRVATAVATELEETPIPAFKTFICPLSREVMKNPVVLVETGQTYEQKEIEKWFKCCAQDGRQPTCPMTGQVLRSSGWRKNLVLQNTIEEWHERNVSAQITRAKQKLSSNSSIKDFEDAVNEIFRISEEGMHHKHTLRNAGIIPLLLRPWHAPLEDGHSLRHKVLDTLCSIASQNEGNKLEMADENVIRFAVKSLTSNLEQEKESAARLLCELSSEAKVCAKIGHQKGGILLLSGFVSSGENATLADLANQTLKNLQRDYSNVISMAEAGRLEPLFDCLSEGPFDVKLQMISHLSNTTLSNNDKEMAVKQAGPFLIEMLSCDNVDKDVALKTLLMLSTPATNAATLVNFGILPPLFNLLNSMSSGPHTTNSRLKEDAAEIFANLLSYAGHWESHTISSDGTTLQSESAIHCFLKLLNRMGLNWKYSLLRILYYIAWSPQTADAAAQHIESGNGIAFLIVCLRESDIDINLQALKVLGVLSLRKSSEVAEELRRTNQFDILKSLLKDFDPEKQAAAAFILANVSLSEREVVEVLGIELIPWIIIELNKSKGSRIKKGGAACFTLMEGLIGLLLQFCKGSDTHILHALREHRVMMVLKEYMGFSLQSSVKKLAAEGLKMLSEKTPNQVDVEPQPSNCCFAIFHKNKHLPQATCHVHGTLCEEATTFCLVKVNAIRPLVDLLEVDDVGVQIAALGALSTLLEDSIDLKSGLEELAKADGIHVIIELFCSAHSSAELQEKIVWMIERVTRIEEMCQKHSMNQVLIKTLVQTFRSTGNPATKRLSQTALTNLKQISGMTGVKK